MGDHFNLILKLQDQLLGVIYDIETFRSGSRRTRTAADHGHGQNREEALILAINEALPTMKRLTEAIEEHWKAMIHEAIYKVARDNRYHTLRRQWLKSSHPRGTNNANV